VEPVGNEADEKQEGNQRASRKPAVLAGADCGGNCGAVGWVGGLSILMALSNVLPAVVWQCQPDAADARVTSATLFSSSKLILDFLSLVSEF